MAMHARGSILRTCIACVNRGCGELIVPCRTWDPAWMRARRFKNWSVRVVRGRVRQSQAAVRELVRRVRRADGEMTCKGTERSGCRNSSKPTWAHLHRAGAVGDPIDSAGVRGAGPARAVRETARGN